MNDLTAHSDAAIQRLNLYFSGRSAHDVLHWGRDAFGAGLVMATGFGPSGVVLMHLAAQLEPRFPILYLDTDLLFPETYALRDRLADRLGLSFHRVSTDLSLDRQETAHGSALWERHPDRCCALRKVEPLRRALAGKRAWITGLRRDQSPERTGVEIVAWDEAFGLVKLNPLAQWTSADVWAYIRMHDLPYNALHDAGYPSIGCVPCTRAVDSGEAIRAGRWSGHGKTECGIHRHRPHA